MNELQRHQDPYQQLASIIREAQQYANRPPQVRGATSERKSQARLPDGTVIDIHERTQTWEVNW